MNRVLIVGLDGASPDLIERWSREGHLPNLRRLMDEGVWGPLESTLPPVTSPAWPSFATGKYPAGHGVFDFVSARNGTFNIVNATAVDSPTLWDILSAHGRRIGVMNVPVTYPPHPVNGFMITGLLSPTASRITYPPALLRRYEDELGRYRVMPVVQYRPGNEETFLRGLEELIAIRLRFAGRLMSDHPWDLMMVHFLATDLVQHAMWRYMDPTHPRHEPASPFKYSIRRIYRRVDAAIGQLLAQVGDDTTVIVMSDHGFGPLHGIVNLNMLLWRAGLLHFKRSLVARLRAGLFRRGVTPARAYEWLTRLNLQNVVSRVSKATRNAVFNRFLSFDDVDWTRTVAYSLGHMGQIYVNLKGREPHGIVSRGAEYERVCDEVIDALRTLTTPDGRPMLEQVVRKAELPPGQHADEGPDLHVVLDGYRYISCPLFATDGNVVSRQIRGDSGCHRRHGVFVARGPDFCSGARVAGARIVDLAPTVLHLMGCPIPDDMDGHVLTEALCSASRVVRSQVAATERASRPGYDLSGEEEAELRDRLRGLGYLE